MTATASSEETAAQCPRWVRFLHTPMRDLLRGRLTTRFDIDRMIASADLPDSVAALVRTVIKRSRLWHTEKEDVAEELITHFRDGLQEEASADELVTTFGNPGHAARLIRRAKKRNRPAAWHAKRYTSLGIVALLLLYSGYGLYFLTGRPNPSIDYLQQVNAAALAIPEEDRAWPIYRSAVLQLDPLPEFEEFIRTPLPGEDGWEVVAEYLRKHQDALTLARQGAQRPGLGFVTGFVLSPEDRKLLSDPWVDSPEDEEVGSSEDEEADAREAADGPLLGALLPPLASLRQLAVALALDAHRAAEAGDGDAVLSNLCALLAISRQVREAPFLISDLSGAAIAALTRNTLAQILARRPGTLSDEQLRDLAHRFASSDDLFSLRLHKERPVFYDLVQRIYTDDGQGDGRPTLRGYRLMHDLLTSPDQFVQRPPSMLAIPALSLTLPSRAEMVDAYELLMDILEADASRPLWEMDASRAAARLSEWRESPIQRGRYLLITELLPAHDLELVWLNPDINLSSRDALLVGIALELYHRRHGAWPPSLDVLVPGLLPSVPPDRFDGRPLRYALINGNPVVYSVGTDRDDDGGRPPRYADGRPNYDGAREWVPEEVLRREPQVDRLNDGDWILWPRPVRPLVPGGAWHLGRGAADADRT
jgi:hypothetical protein